MDDAVGTGVAADLLLPLLESLATANIVLRLDAEGRCVWISPSVTTVLGHEPADLVGQRPREWIHPDDRDAVVAERDASYRDGTVHSQRARYRTADGGYRWLASSGFAVRGGDGAISDLVGQLEDVDAVVRAELAHAEQVEQYRLLAENTTDVVTRISAAGVVEYVSPSVHAMTGWRPEELLGTEPTVLIHPDDMPVVVQGRAGSPGGPAVPLRVRLRCKDGTFRWVEYLVTALTTPSGAPAGRVSVTRDIGAQVAAEHALDRERTIGLISALQQAIAMFAAVRDDSGAIVDFRWEYANPAALHVEQATAEERIGRLLTRTTPAVLGFGIVSAYADVVEHGTVFHAELTREAHGAYPGGTFDITASRYDDGVVVSWFDTTERVVLEQTLRSQSLHDQLTGLPNRLLLMDRIDHAMARGRRESLRSAVLLLDLDRFKDVNDGYGHSAGDDLLLACANRLRGAAREVDTVARWGGDEFVVLCEGVSVAEAQQVATRLLSAFDRPFDLGEYEVVVTASVGIATLDEDTTAEDVLRYADAAMYRAKGAGRDRIEVFDATMRDRLRERMDLESDLRRAVEHDQFVVHYQPVVDAAAGTWFGVEALVRWQHPTRGLVPPEEFVPLAEELGLIVPIGTGVLRAACHQAMAWLPQLPNLVVSVNVSPRQFALVDFADEVLRALADSGLEAERLRLEVTESTLMADTPVMQANLDRLADRGIGLSVDDFGTGYSSLLSIKRLRGLVELKIDGSFVRGAPHDPEDLAIITAVTHLGHDLGLKVVAEGVETEAQRDVLLAVGCTRMQGHLFGLPAAADQLDVGAATGLDGRG